MWEVYVDYQKKKKKKSDSKTKTSLPCPNRAHLNMKTLLPYLTTSGAWWDAIMAYLMENGHLLRRNLAC